MLSSTSMSMQNCSKCGALLPAEVNFCRQCGTPVTAALAGERQTIQLDLTSENAATRRLRPRPTGSETGFSGIKPEPSGQISPLPSPPTSKLKAALALITLAVVLIAACVIIWAALIRPKRVASTAGSAETLVYPNSRTILNTTSGDGKAIQLQTDDSTDQVVSWYKANLSPTKTLQLTPTTVVLKNQTVTVTIVADNKTTTVLIKQVLP